MKHEILKGLITIVVITFHLNSGFAQFVTNNTGFTNYLSTHPKTRGIGIGNFTTSPLSALHINTNLFATSPYFTPGEVFRTVSPSTQLAAWRMFTGTGNGTEKFVLFNPAGSTLVTLQSTQDGMSFNTGGASERMRILANGNIGIGTITPARILEVRTTIPQLRLSNGTGFTEFFTTAAGHLSIAPSAGNVGIGLNTPQSRLHLHNVTTPTITTEQSIYEQYTVDGVLNGTGSLANDGFRVGVRGFWNGTAFQSVAELRQQEAANMNFYN